MVEPKIRNWKRYGTTIEVGRSQLETKTQQIFARLGFQTMCMLVGAFYNVLYTLIFYMYREETHIHCILYIYTQI